MKYVDQSTYHTSNQKVYGVNGSIPPPVMSLREGIKPVSNMVKCLTYTGVLIYATDTIISLGRERIK